MADILRCDFRLPGRAPNHGEFVATGLGDGRGRYRLTPAGRLWRILPKDSQAHEPCPLTGVVRLRPKGRRASTEYLLTFISGTAQAVQAVPVMAPVRRAKALMALAREERALRRAVGRTTQKMFAQLTRIDPEIAALVMLVFDDRKKAATWLSRPHLLLGSRSPFELIAQGRRRMVLEELNTILNGFPT